jgi:hypothetical protein
LRGFRANNIAWLPASAGRSMPALNFRLKAEATTG